MVVRALLRHLHQTSHLLILEGGSAPENLTGRLRLLKPELILFIDAAHLGESSGTVQWIPLDAIDGMSASSHSLPLSLLAHYLALEIRCDIAILGIQPEQNDFDAECSQPVLFAVEEIVSEISKLFHLRENNNVPYYKEIYPHS
jgi:hydrogenase 3 maturation protease